MKLIPKEKDNVEVTVEGHKLLLSHLDKILYPHEKYTKSHILDYYQSVASYILPYLKDRPLMMHRYPNGIEHEGFYQKNVDDTPPKWVETVMVRHENKKINYIVVQDQATLVYVVNLGCIEFHPFHSRISDAHHPDYLILDLDPEDISFEHVIETAQVLREFLSKAKIKCYCKTSGGRGLHVYVPLGNHYHEDQVKAFSELIALRIQEKLPEIISLERMPKKRQKKVYIDFLRNSFGQTVVAPYSLRPKPGAPVSTPLKWSEVKKGLDPLDFTIETVPQRLKRVGDLFADVLEDINPNGLEALLKGS